jgi:hypothetical protein
MARMVLARFVLRWAARRRISARRVASDRIIAALKDKTGMFRCAVFYMRRCVVRIQRAVRLMLRRRKAQVALHMRLIRHPRCPQQSIENAYWLAAGRSSGFVTRENWTEQALSREVPQVPAPLIERRLLYAISAASRRFHRDFAAWENTSSFTSAHPNASAADLRAQTSLSRGSFDAAATLQQGSGIWANPVGLSGTFEPPPLGSGRFSPTVDPPSAGGSFSNPSFASGAADPATSLYALTSRSELSSATARTASQRSPSSRPAPVSGSPGRPASFPSEAPRRLSATTFASLSQLSKLKRPRYSVFLPRAALFNVLDESCYAAARMQKDPRWLAHLDKKTASSRRNDDGKL